MREKMLCCTFPMLRDPIAFVQDEVQRQRLCLSADLVAHLFMECGSLGACRMYIAAWARTLVTSQPVAQGWWRAGADLNRTCRVVRFFFLGLIRNYSLDVSYSTDAKPQWEGSCKQMVSCSSWDLRVDRGIWDQASIATSRSWRRHTP